MFFKSLLLCLAILPTTVSFACENGESLLTESRPKELITIVIVGGYSSGGDIAPELAAAGIKNIIHIHPAKEIPAALKPSFKAKDYSEDMVYNGNLAETIAKLKSKGTIDAVFAGTETSVHLADRINEALGLRGNSTRYSDARRNKWLMQARVAEAGLDSIRSLKSKNLEEIYEWIESPNGNQGSFPVIVKPIDGAGTQGVYTCYNKDQVLAAFKALIGTKNVLDIPVEEVLVQEYLMGVHETSVGKNKYLAVDEYVVNTVSRDGKHVVGEVWRYNKRKVARPDGGHSKIYEYDELLAFNSPTVKRLVDYAKQVLNALEIGQGPAHMEIMMTKRGPVLIEVGARLMGGHTFAATRTATGTSPLDLMIKNAIAPQEFDALSKDGAIKREKLVRNVQLISKQTGTITKLNYTAEELKQLMPSFVSISSAGVGEKLTPTIDLVTAPGSMWLIHESPAVIERDYRMFRKLIEPNLFEVK